MVVGPNGEGKTNLLEGMFFLYALRSPRASTNAPLVRDEAEVGYVRGEFEGGRPIADRGGDPTQGSEQGEAEHEPAPPQA